MSHKLQWATLVIFDNPQHRLKSSKYPIFEGETVIGSDEQKCNMCLKLEKIDPVHCKVEITCDGEAWIEDLSQNGGIYKNAPFNPSNKIKLKKNKQYELYPETEIFISQYKCYFVKFNDIYNNNNQESVINQNQSQLQHATDFTATLVLDDRDVNQDQNDHQNVPNFNQNIPQFDHTLQLDDINSQNQENNQDELKKQQNYIDYQGTLILDDRDDSITPINGISGQQQSQQLQHKNMAQQLNLDYLPTLALPDQESDENQNQTQDQTNNNQNAIKPEYQKLSDTQLNNQQKKEQDQFHKLPPLDISDNNIESNKPQIETPAFAQINQKGNFKSDLNNFNTNVKQHYQKLDIIDELVTAESQFQIQQQSQINQIVNEVKISPKKQLQTFNKVQSQQNQDQQKSQIQIQQKNELDLLQPTVIQKDDDEEQDAECQIHYKDQNFSKQEQKKNSISLDPTIINNDDDNCNNNIIINEEEKSKQQQQNDILFAPTVIENNKSSQNTPNKDIISTPNAVQKQNNQQQLLLDPTIINQDDQIQDQQQDSKEELTKYVKLQQPQKQIELTETVVQDDESQEIQSMDCCAKQTSQVQQQLYQSQKLKQTSDGIQINILSCKNDNQPIEGKIIQKELLSKNWSNFNQIDDLFGDEGDDPQQLSNSIGYTQLNAEQKSNSNSYNQQLFKISINQDKKNINESQLNNNFSKFTPQSLQIQQKSNFLSSIFASQNQTQTNLQQQQQVNNSEDKCALQENGKPKIDLSISTIIKEEQNINNSKRTNDPKSKGRSQEQLLQDEGTLYKDEGTICKDEGIIIKNEGANCKEEGANSEDQPQKRKKKKLNNQDSLPTESVESLAAKDSQPEDQVDKKSNNSGKKPMSGSLDSNPKSSLRKRKLAKATDQLQPTDSKDNIALRIMFSGHVPNEKEKRKIKFLNAQIEENFQNNFDLLVVGDLKRSVKLMTAMIKNVPIVSVKWVEDSINKNELLTDLYDKYIPETNQEFQNKCGGTLQNFIKTRQKLQNQEEDFKIFEGYRFWLSDEIELINEIKHLIQSGGGQVELVLPMKKDQKDEKFLCILSEYEQDLQIYRKMKKNKVKTYKCDLIYDAAVTSLIQIQDNIILEESYFQKMKKDNSK